jgi:hypothetical protein
MLTVPTTLYWMSWILPLSVIWAFLVSILIPAYDSRLNYGIAMSSYFFMMLNALFSWVSSLYFAIVYSANHQTSKRFFNVALGLLFTVWGQYHFRRKMGEVTRLTSFTVYDGFYCFCLFIIVNVAYMMSTGVGNGS